MKSGNLNFLERSGPVTGLLYLYLRPAKIKLLENILHEHNFSLYEAVTSCHINCAKKSLLLTSFWPIVTIILVLYCQPYQYQVYISENEVGVCTSNPNYAPPFEIVLQKLHL
jgi:hypothetical protein